MARIPSSRISEHGRMDAAFHLAVERAGKTLDEITQALDPDQALDQAQGIASALPAAVRTQALAPLRRGEATGAMSIEEAWRLIAHHPHLALAMLGEAIAQGIGTLEAQAQKLETSRVALVGMAQDLARLVPSLESGAAPSRPRLRR